MLGTDSVRKKQTAGRYRQTFFQAADLGLDLPAAATEQPLHIFVMDPTAVGGGRVRLSCSYKSLIRLFLIENGHLLLPNKDS